MNEPKSVFQIWTRGQDGKEEDVWVTATVSAIQKVSEYSGTERIKMRSDVMPRAFEIDYELPVDEEILKQRLSQVAA
ncbi:hypothetical protein [Hydrocarboniclastica marina]|uniref:Uncharacterized protein n=1 Tax=Hydrocarboniclastica marina TaxID=2259620 RepID=A0A4P7XLI8_9ALTE|nr:hypothetical protein [Hydrocarboniclastica marina]QCF28116.1 hypothetical protein soil367_18770 [Hydrocarboniclastica marina]